MKKVALILIVTIITMAQGQETKHIPLVNVSGEGKIKVNPDELVVTVSLETKGAEAAIVKKGNDEKIDAVLKYIKKMGILKENYQTQNVSLYPNYDYENKKHNYVANQTIQIFVKDLSKYEELMDGLVKTGINRIDSVEFKTSKLKQLQVEARKLAVLDAKNKAQDYVAALGQKIGKAFTISDQSQMDYPQHKYAAMSDVQMDQALPRETLAIGQIEVISSVTISFVLD
jgi:uncharacterized protein